MILNSPPSSESVRTAVQAPTLKHHKSGIEYQAAVKGRLKPASMGLNVGFGDNLSCFPWWGGSSMSGGDWGII